MANIQQVSFPAQAPRRKRVAAYARVSSGKDAMLHSLSAQISHYSEQIQTHPGWHYAGVYADEAKTGTKDSRENFQRLLADCRAGKIDMVITKSISRFARNTVTLLESVRELKALGVDIFFEEQSIHTLSADGELLLTILAGYAEEESRSVSENMKWRVRRNFEQGKPWRYFMLGYRNQDDRLTVIPEAAAIVRSIFADYLAGDGIVTIMNRLNENGILSQSGCAFHESTVERILHNYAYTGNLLLQTKYRENYRTKKTLVNRGQLPQYHVTESHEAIIDPAVFEAVQAEMERRREKCAPRKEKQIYPFSGKILCARCGKHYRRKTTATGPVWICSTYNAKGKDYCAAKAMPERTLTELLGGMPFDTIIAEDVNKLVVKSGDTETVLHWQDRSRSESWTEEKRAAAGAKTRERRRTHADR